ncbi:MAG: hypothetical protein GY714_05455 [Desulfobacterales bacterium]|nr:hypothetical protein [Desulfobacterales bacterium]
MMKIEVEGYKKEYRKLIGTYQFEGVYNGILPDPFYLTIKVYISSKGSFYAKPDLGIRDNTGMPMYADAYGATEKEAIENTLNEIKVLVKENYPNSDHDYAVVYRNAEDKNDEKEINSRFPKEYYDFDDWRQDKLRRNLKSGPYIEFQLENEGGYKHWCDNSIFIGNAVFDPVYKTFCREQNDFDTWGVNLFTVSELHELKEKIIERLEILKSITSISEYVEKIAPVQKWCHESGKPIWKELRDSTIEFLNAVLLMIEEGINKEKALFILGV